MLTNKVLFLTERGKELELGLPVEGGEFPRMSKLVILTGAALETEAEVLNLTEWSDVVAEVPLGAPDAVSGVRRYVDGNGAVLLGHLLADVDIGAGKKITGIGVELVDGSKYAYAAYYPAYGGIPKAVGMALTLDVVLALPNARALTVRYEPFDSGAMADAAMAGMSAIPRIVTDIASQTEDVGDIWSSQYKTMMSYRNFGGVSLYASNNLGDLLPISSNEVRAGFIGLGEVGLLKSDYPALIAKADHLGWLVDADDWQPRSWQFCDYGDGTFGTPALIDFIRFAHSGREVGSYQETMSQIPDGVLLMAKLFGYADGTYDHSGVSHVVGSADFHPAPYGSGDLHSNNRYPETRPDNTAFAGMIKAY